MNKKHVYINPAILLVVLLLAAVTLFSLYLIKNPIHDISLSFFDKKEKEQKVLVLKVIDGDTLRVQIDGKEESIRLIGIDAPEKYAGKAPECFAEESKIHLEQLLQGKNIHLEVDLSQDDRDVYGRLLRYVYIEEGDNINFRMIRDGFAREFTYKHPYWLQEEFREAEYLSKTSNSALWSSCQEK